LRHKGFDIAGELTVVQQAPAVSADKGTKHCRLAAFDSMPQRSWLKRAQDIAGKQHRKPQRSQPLRARDIAGERC
jgi:hypothetical protein